MELEKYIKGNTWCSFKNNDRTLFYRSIWTYGVHKYKHPKIENVITEDICIYFPESGRQIRAFKGDEPMLSEKTLQNFKVEDLLLYIGKYNTLRNDLNFLQESLDQELENIAVIKKVINTEAYIYAYEYLISGLVMNFDLAKYPDICKDVEKWKNNPENTEPWVYNRLFNNIILQYSLNISLDDLKKYITFKELLALLENKMDKNNLLEKIRNRKKQGFIFLNFHQKYYYGKVISNEKINISIRKFLNALELKQLKANTSYIIGTPTFPFVSVEGKCVVISDNQKVDVHNKIVIVSILTANDLFDYLDAKCLIVDYGGYFSHAAICSREYQKPCLIDCRIATHFFKTGQELKVDGITGRVDIIE